MMSKVLIFGVGFIAGSIYTYFKVCKHIATYIYNYHFTQEA